MAQFSRVVLRRSKEDAVRRFHPWIFSGAIAQVEAEDGDIVEVFSNSGQFLAIGLYHSSNIAVKILAFHPVTDLDDLFTQRIQEAYHLRSQLGLTESETTNCYRLINAEGDNLPGLIVDWYNGTAVVQAYSVGMAQQRHRILAALRSVYGDKLRSVYDKSAAVLPHTLNVKPEYLLGEKEEGLVLEYGHRFQVDWETGQKTGFFLDQREHRQLLTHYSAGKQVLNTFSYSGGFSVYALQAGASLVHSVDSSAKAIDLTKQNIALNPIPNSAGTHEAFTDDVFDFLKNCDQQYDAIVLDPPAFAKNVSARHQAVMAYKRLNLQAFHRLRPGSVLFTFSCSQVVQRDHFQGAVLAAAIESGRSVRILHHLTQPADHPVNLFHPEGLYLKGLVLWVE